MKKLKTRELMEFNETTKKNCLTIYRQLLGNVINQYASYLDRPSAGLGYLRAKRWDLFFQWGKSQSVQSYSDTDERSAFVRTQIVSLIKKYPWSQDQIGIDPTQVAKANFLKTESMCRRMNKILHLTLYSSHLDSRSETALIRELIPKMRGFIGYVLGDEPNIDRIMAHCDFTGGSNIGCSGEKVNLARKLLATPTCTPGAFDIASGALMRHAQYADVLHTQMGLEHEGTICYDPGEVLLRLRDCTKFLSYNKIEFVDKTGDTKRVIAKEAILNTYAQKGVDVEMRLLLKRVGIDLTNQDLNQRLARKGSDEWFTIDPVCTIDLTNASDLECTTLVREVFPESWFSLLDKLRSRSYSFDGNKTRRLEKFTTSGNGFCFPVESLVFASILFACGVRNFGSEAAVYGDDLICNKRFYDPVIRALKALGFVPNERKSFSEGPFRESCGGDFYAGEDIRPYTLDHKLDSIEALFKFINLTQRNAHTYAFFQRERERIFRSIPTSLQFVRPFKGPEDTGINGIGFSPEHPNVRFNRLTMSYSWKELSITPKIDDDEFPPWIVYAAALRGHTPIGMFAYKRSTRTRVVRANKEEFGPYSPREIEAIWFPGPVEHHVALFPHLFKLSRDRPPRTEVDKALQ